jgi:hypothetical protein
MGKKYIYIIIFIQIVILVFLYFFFKKNLGISISNINTRSIQKIPSKNLGHFYEPKANSIMNVRADWMSTLPKQTINADSLNERHDYSLKKETGVFRIVTLGDSFTFGENIDTKDNYPEQLEDLLNLKCSKNKFEVINLGVPGYDLQYMNERFIRRGSKYSPDLVIVLLGDFQLFRLNEELDKRIESIKKSNPQIDDLALTINVTKQLVSDMGWNSMLNWQKTEIKKLAATINSKLVILKFPAICQDNKHSWFSLEFECWPFISYDGIVNEIARENNNIQILNSLRRGKVSSSYDGHPTIEGNATIAESLFSYLKEKKIIQCDK